jgi:hypothetical protein
LHGGKDSKDDESQTANPIKIFRQKQKEFVLKKTHAQSTESTAFPHGNSRAAANKSQVSLDKNRTHNRGISAESVHGANPPLIGEGASISAEDSPERLGGHSVHVSLPSSQPL